MQEIWYLNSRKLVFARA